MATTLQLCLEQVLCKDETNGKFVEMVGHDDMAIAGVAIDMNGSTHAIPQLNLGEFDDKTVKNLKDRPFAQFNLASGNGFPRTYAVTLILAEKDHGGLMKLVDQLPGPIHGAILAQVQKAGGKIAATAGGVVGTAVGGPVGAVLGALAGGEVSKAIGKLGKALGDDIFPAQTVELTLDSANQVPSNAKKQLIFEAHGGKYRVDVEWKLA